MHSLFIKFLNFKERIHHSHSSAEITLLKKTNLFSNMSDSEFDSMCRSLKLIRYPAGSLILREGEKGEDFYIIQEGSVRVFTLDKDSNKIPLARLNKGDYFGEQALLGQANKSRNANIETIDFTTLLVIAGKAISKQLRSEKNLSSKGLKEAVKKLSLINESYSHLEKLMAEIPNPEIVEFTQDETIFNIGDKANYVYFILQGDVKILFPAADSHKFNSIILHKGHLFGELGILDNKPRKGTAISIGNTQLLRVNGEDFKKYVPKHEEMQKILAGLRKVDQIPKRGSIEQYFGSTTNKIPVFTTVYNLEDGRTVVSSKISHQDEFSMRTVNLTNEKCYQYKKDSNQIIIYTQNQRWSGIETLGPCDYLPEICGMILDNEIAEDSALLRFEASGEIPVVKRINRDPSAIICDCLLVTRKQIQDQIEIGIKDLPGISKATGACTSCGACRYRILEMLGQSIWSSGTLKKIITHNSYINSYQITLENSKFNEFRPGQHVVIQIRVDNSWIERPYSISDILLPDGSLRITIKKEPQGYFSGWLFSQTQQEFQINATQAQGDFTLKEGMTPILCFAGGIGITPFITFARHISQKQLKQKMHLVYTALAQEDFIVTDVLNQLAKENPFFTVEYRSTNVEGYLTESDISRSVQALGAPDVYICGPAPFLSLIEGVLKNQKYPSDKIHIEKFVHAGGK